ncbi:MAG TPA: hypothetical protein VI300_00035 [Solirubrobacter sp.]
MATPDWLHKLLVYFGLATPKPAPGERWIAARASLVVEGALTLALALASAALVLVVFDWRPLDVLEGTTLGVVLWGGVAFFTVVRSEVPRAASLPAAPADAEVEPAFRFHPAVLAVVPLILGLAWLADRWELGAVFVPGQLAGSAVAKLLGAWLVSRWQHAHGHRVLSRQPGTGEPELYVVA